MTFKREVCDWAFASSVDGQPLVVLGVPGAPMTVLGLPEAHQLIEIIGRGQGELTTGRAQRRVVVISDGADVIVSINGNQTRLSPADADELAKAICKASAAALRIPEVVSGGGAGPVPCDPATMTPRELEVVESFGLYAKS
jgi:hypothetical protein